MPDRAADVGEFGLTDRFPEWLADVPAPAVTVGSGDDCAVLRATLTGEAPEVCFTTDAQVEGVHFRRDWVSWADVGWRALTAAVSDIAAMGGRPLGAIVGLAVPASTPVADLRDFAAGLQAAGVFTGCPVVGGNLARAPGGWQVTTSVLGEPGGRWLRSGAQPGDALWVSGRPGRAHAGWQALEQGLGPDTRGVADALAAFRRPKPRFLVVGAIAAAGATAAVHAAIDLSDSLVRCCERLATASGVGLVLEAGALPVDRATTAVAAACGADPREWVLHGGESFELAAVAPPGALDGVAAALDATGVAWTRIGTVRAGAGVVLRDGDAERPADPDAGFRHY